MKIKIYAILSILSALLLVFLLSCGGDGETMPDDKNVASDIGANDGGDTKTPDGGLLYDSVPELDFDGYEFRVMTGKIEFFVWDFFPEQIGEVLNDSLYTRNKKIEERFNIQFKATSIDLLQLAQAMKKDVKAGADAYDEYMQIDRDAYTASAEHLLYPVGDLPYVDLTRPYWCQLPNRQLTVGGKQYVAFSDEMLSFFEAAVIVYFNKKQVADFGFEDFYGLIRSGNWTHDRFFEYAKLAVRDLDGDGKMGEADNWGIASDTDLIYQCFWTSSGKYMVEKDSADIPYFAVPGNDTLFDVAEKVIDQFNSMDGLLMDGYKQKFTQFGANGRTARVTFFKEGHSLFCVGFIPEMIQLRDMADDFGILPFPKYTPDQAQYYTRASGGFPFVIPTTNQRLEIAGAVMEAMACETRNVVIPAYYESSLKTKYSRDADTAEMLDLIYETRVYDLGDTIWYSPIRIDYTNIFASGKNTFVSDTEKNTDKYNGIIQKAVEKILENS